VECRDGLKDYVREYDETKEVPSHIDDYSVLQKIQDVFDQYRHQMKLYFTYLLLRGSVIDSAEKLTFKLFLTAIFYCGKGLDQRVIQHLVDAAKIEITEAEEKDLEKFFEENRRVDQEKYSKKSQTIREEWANNYPIYPFVVTSFLHEAESLALEAFIIKAYGKL
jgi:hypothetical protein